MISFLKIMTGIHKIKFKHENDTDSKNRLSPQHYRKSAIYQKLHHLSYNKFLHDQIHSINNQINYFQKNIYPHINI